MKLVVLAASLIVSVALAPPAAAAKKQKKKSASRADIHRMAARPGADPYAVYFGGQIVGRDPDPGIRAYMTRTPNIWDGPE